MSDSRLRLIAALGLVVGAALGIAGTFASSASLVVLVGASNVMPRWVQGIGFIAAALFTIVAVQIFLRHELTPLSQPLPFFAYPFFAATLVGWAWVQYRDTA